jgi:Tfp pilus assembly protein PilP
MLGVSLDTIASQLVIARVDRLLRMPVLAGLLACALVCADGVAYAQTAATRATPTTPTQTASLQTAERIASQGNAVNLRVRDAAVSELLFELARMDAIPLVMGNGTFDARLSLEESFASPRAAIDAIVSRSGLRAMERGGVVVVTDACTGALPAKVLNPFSDNRLSLDFFRLDMPTTLSLLQWVSSRELDEGGFAGGKGRRVGMTLANQPARIAYEAMAAATGTVLLSAGNRSYVISELADIKKTCATSDVAAGSSTTSTPAPDRERAQCPRMSAYPATAETPCQPLEFYKLDEIRLRGMIRRGSIILAIVDTNDGLAWSVTTGQYLGEHHARVETLDENGLMLKELFINRYGYPFDRRLAWTFDGKRTELAD